MAEEQPQRPGRGATRRSSSTPFTRRRRAGQGTLLLLPLAAASLLLAAAAAERATVRPPTLARRSGPAVAFPPGIGHDNVHTVFLTDCTAYSDWQTVTLIFSWRESQQPGPLSRVMCCTPAEAASYSGAMLSLVPTHVAPSLTKNPHNNDTYAAYNKPAAIIDWLAHKPPKEEYVLVLDSDMILRHPFLPGRFPMVRPGWAVSGKYDYMAGVKNELAETFVPHVEPRNDVLAGPVGRKADQVGGFFFIRSEDLKKVSTEWLTISERVRFDPTAWRTTGDAFAKTPGAKPWISEMYGYSFSASKHGVWHTWTPSAMLYPGYVPEGVPLLLHYGLEIRVRIPDPSTDDAQMAALRRASDADARGEVDDDGGDGRDELISAALLAREMDAGPEVLAVGGGGGGAAGAGAGAEDGGGGGGGAAASSSADPSARAYVWSWDKHQFTRHNVSRCPPWTVVVKHPPHGLFAQPPLPDMLDPAEEPLERYTNLIAIETVHTANAALCEWYLSQCPTKTGDWLRRRCARVRRGYGKVKAALREMDARFACADFYRGCHAWSLSGECGKNPKFMRYNCQRSCGVCPEPPKAPPPGEYMPIALVGLPPGTVGAVAAADVGGGGGRGDGGGGGSHDNGGGNNNNNNNNHKAAVVEAIIDPMAPEASEGNAPGEGIHPERRIRREQQLAAKRAAKAERERAAEERRARAEAAAAARGRRGVIGGTIVWLARLLHPARWRESLSAAAAAVDSLASGEGAALGGPAEGGPGGVVGGAPGQISPARAKRLRAAFIAAPEALTREDLLRHCHTQLLSASMAELVDCTDSARLGLMYLTAEERADQEERKARAREEQEEEEEEAAAAKGKRRGGWGWGRRRRNNKGTTGKEVRQQQQQHEGRTAAAVEEEAKEDGAADAVIAASDQADRGRRPAPRQRDAVGEAPGASRDEGGGVESGQSGGSGRWALALMVWLGALGLVLQLIPRMWRRTSPSLRAQIIRRVKSKGDA